MAKNYSYPRVTMSTFAKKHSHNVINVPDTTVMFAPLVTEKGPDDRIVKIHTLAEFIETFGSFNEEFYNLNGQMALNIYNWLSNGGTLMVKRLTEYPEEKTDAQGFPEKVYHKSNKAVNTDSFVSLKISLTGAEFVNGKYSNTANADGKKTVFEIVNYPAFKASFKLTAENGKKKIISDKRFIISKSEIKVDDKGNEILLGKPTKTIYLLDESSTVPVEDEDKKIITANLKYYNSTDKNSAPVIISVTESETFTKAYDKNGNIVTGYFIDSTEENCHGQGEEHEPTCYFKEYENGNPSDRVVPVAMTAKYCGSYYNNVYLEATRVGKSTPAVFNFTVYYEDPITKKSTALEKFLQKTEGDFMAALSSSEYVEVFNIKDDLFKENANDIPQTKKFTLCAGTNAISNYKLNLSAIEEYWEVEGSDPTEEDKRTRYLVNRLETPIDIIFDAGYPESIKNAMVAFVRNDGNDGVAAKRDDIVCILDNWQLANDLRLALPEEIIYSVTGTPWLSVTKPTNIAIYEQYFTILDDTFTNQNIYVTPTYFLTKLFAYNDQTYGLQYPTAGLRRGILDDAIAINLNPSPDQKEAWFIERINYVEKTSREYAFMSQRTFDGSSDMEYTALSFLNNERVLERMKKDLEALGRSYLHEFNDAVTIANMTTVLNKYVSNWISNRTLSMGVVTVEQNAVSENALDINLNIRFTNTIEVINVSIVIE